MPRVYDNKGNTIVWTASQEEKDYVLRKAMLLGFEAEEYEIAERIEHTLPDGGRRFIIDTVTRWKFTFEGIQRTAYSCVHDAALDFLRLMNLPHCSGDRGHGQD